jgi:hypothetical protein
VSDEYEQLSSEALEAGRICANKVKCIDVLRNCFVVSLKPLTYRGVSDRKVGYCLYLRTLAARRIPVFGSL